MAFYVYAVMRRYLFQVRLFVHEAQVKNQCLSESVRMMTCDLVARRLLQRHKIVDRFMGRRPFDKTALSFVNTFTFNVVE